MSPGSVGRREVWEGSGFAKEHLAPVGAAVLRRGAAAPGFYSQPGSGSGRERAAARRWLSCASPRPGGSLGAQLGEVGSHLPPPHQQRWVCRESSLVAAALLCRGSPGRRVPWQIGLCGCCPADRSVPGGESRT